MNGLICDNCGKARPPKECATWIGLGLLNLHGGDPLLLSLFESEAQKEERARGQAEREKHPLNTFRHFCDVECVQSFLANGLRGVIEAARQ